MASFKQIANVLVNNTALKEEIQQQFPGARFGITGKKTHPALLIAMPSLDLEGVMCVADELDNNRRYAALRVVPIRVQEMPSAISPATSMIIHLSPR